MNKKLNKSVIVILIILLLGVVGVVTFLKLSNVNLVKIKLPKAFKYKAKYDTKITINNTIKNLELISNGGLILKDNYFLGYGTAKIKPFNATLYIISAKDEKAWCEDDICYYPDNYLQDYYFDWGVNISNVYIDIVYDLAKPKLNEDAAMYLNSLKKKVYFENGLIVIEIPLNLEVLEKLSKYTTNDSLLRVYFYGDLNYLKNVNINGYIKFKIDIDNTIREINCKITAKYKQKEITEVYQNIDIYPSTESSILNEIFEKEKKWNL